MKTVLCAIAAVCLAFPAWGQDAGDAADEPARPAASAGAPEPDQAQNDSDEATAEGAAGEAGRDTAAEPDENAAGGPVVVEVEEGGVLDDQTFEGDDDDFIPSEEIPVDQPIPFPTDI